MILGADFKDLSQEQSGVDDSEGDENDPFRLWRLIGFLPRRLMSPMIEKLPRKNTQEEEQLDLPYSVDQVV